MVGTKDADTSLLLGYTGLPLGIDDGVVGDVAEAVVVGAHGLWVRCLRARFRLFMFRCSPGTESAAVQRSLMVVTW